MEHMYGLNPEQYRAFSKWHKIIAILLVLLLAVLWLLGYGPGAFRHCTQENVSSDESRESPATHSTTVPTPTAPALKKAAPDSGATQAPQVDANAAPGAPVDLAQRAQQAVTNDVPRAEPTAVLAAPVAEVPGMPLSGRVYFPRDKYRLPDDAPSGLAKVVAYLKENPNARVQISGFHDRLGALSYNVELANKRAKAVAQALENAGVPAGQLQLQQPSQTRGSGKPEEARRVELNVTN